MFHKQFPEHFEKPDEPTNNNGDPKPTITTTTTTANVIMDPNPWKQIPGHNHHPSKPQQMDTEIETSNRFNPLMEEQPQENEEDWPTPTEATAMEQTQAMTVEKPPAKQRLSLKKRRTRTNNFDTQNTTTQPTTPIPQATSDQEQYIPPTTAPEENTPEETTIEPNNCSPWPKTTVTHPDSNQNPTLRTTLNIRKRDREPTTPQYLSEEECSPPQKMSSTPWKEIVMEAQKLEESFTGPNLLSESEEAAIADHIFDEIDKHEKETQVKTPLPRRSSIKPKLHTSINSQTPSTSKPINLLEERANPDHPIQVFKRTYNCVGYIPIDNQDLLITDGSFSFLQEVPKGMTVWVCLDLGPKELEALVARIQKGEPTQKNIKNICINLGYNVTWEARDAQVDPDGQLQQAMDNAIKGIRKTYPNATISIFNNKAPATWCSKTANTSMNKIITHLSDGLHIKTTTLKMSLTKDTENNILTPKDKPAAKKEILTQLGYSKN